MDSWVCKIEKGFKDVCKVFFSLKQLNGEAVSMEGAVWRGKKEGGELIFGCF